MPTNPQRVKSPWGEVGEVGVIKEGQYKVSFW